MILNVDKYQVNNPLLKRIIKFFWIIEKNDATFDHKILQQNDIDLLLNFSTSLNCLQRQATHSCDLNRHTSNLQVAKALILFFNFLYLKAKSMIWW